MSARVLNPVVLTELYKLRSPSTVRRNIPCNRKLTAIKKDLFGSPNPIETKKIFEDELEKHQDTACKKWGFDFRNGYPVGGQSQYIWERVSFTEFIPEMYTLSRAAHLREIQVVEPSPDDLLLDERAARQNASPHIDAFTEEVIEEDLVFKAPVEDRLTTTTTSSSAKKRQPKITEYMKERKRLAPTPKKISPAKRMRSFFSSTASGSLERN